MDLTAHLKYVRVSHTKAAEVADLIRGCDVNKAVDLLSYSQRKSGAIILKLLNSILANAKTKQIVDLDSLFVKSIFVNKAPSLKKISSCSSWGSCSY